MGVGMSKKTETIQNNGVASGSAGVPPNPAGVPPNPAGVPPNPVDEKKHNLQNGNPQSGKTVGGSRKKKIKFKRIKNKTNKKQKKSKSPKYLNIQNN